METVDKRFVLIAKDGDRLYPYKKVQRNTNRCGYALTKPGEQDRNGQGTYTDDIQEVIRRLVVDGWSVRTKTTDKAGRQREGSFGINKRSVHGYEIDEAFEHLVVSAIQKPLSVMPANRKTKNFKAPLNQEFTALHENPVDESIYRAIKTRRGQPEFRKALLMSYGGKCCISNCDVENVLEAAHIVPHTEETNYSLTNGLLLRSDIHTLYDLNLVGIDAKGVVFIPKNLKNSEYWQFQGRYIDGNIPEPMSENLKRRFASYKSDS